MKGGKPTSSLNNLDGKILSIFSTEMPSSASHTNSFSGVRPPYSADRNLLMPSFERVGSSSSPLLNCNWYEKCGATFFTISSSGKNFFCGGAYGTQTVKRCETRSGCHRATR